ncbi:MAG: hypothetical protein M0Z32_06675 [Actinomycetota bacterium]|jgi:hypothetical protein|nr:hypothetical protein [Actinomycetota bacterium]MCL6093081.1 hypothetical protein [Actinomycetota bacterium]MDA8167411.1 hypothetical protein [Actinomycetota bacterium]
MMAKIRKPAMKAEQVARAVAASGRRVPLPTYGAALLATLITVAGLSSLF